MQETKFRIWDIVRKKMNAPSLVHISKTGTVRIAADLDFKDKECVIQQYTGLKDKNGKEIYEGDIISDSRKDKRIVEFIRGGFWCSYPDGEIYMPHQSYREIIGNIYENPNLI